MQLDDGLGARLGMIVLSTDETLEHEVGRVCHGRAVNMLHARIPSHAQVTPETLQQMEAAMTDTAALLPTDLSVIGYACTSGATVIGPETVQARVQAAHAGVPVTNPISAVIAALNALGANRIALVTPYVKSVTEPMRAFLANHGIETISERSFREQDDRTVARISEASTFEAMLEAGAADVDAVFTSCTNLRSFGVIEQAEAALGKPVISSNQALIWHMLTLAGISAKGWGPGRLFEEAA